VNLMPFLLFAFVASITPGPTNILVLTNSQHYGVKATLPALVSACAAASAIVLISGAGAGELLRQYPLVRQVMSWAGVLWLSWMSWQLFCAPAANLSRHTHTRFTARAAALLQVINPKTWMMALAVVSLFAPAGEHALRDIALMALWFLLISIACLPAVLGMAGTGGKQAVSDHYGDGAFSAPDGAVSLHFSLGGDAGLSQRPTFATLREMQDIFRQPLCRIDIGLAAVHQHPAEAPLHDQIHLLSHHRRIVHFQGGQQFMGKVMRGALLLIGKLVDRMARIREKGTGGNKQAARIAVVTHTFGERRVARQ